MFFEILPAQISEIFKTNNLTIPFSFEEIGSVGFILSTFGGLIFTSLFLLLLIIISSTYLYKTKGRVETGLDMIMGANLLMSIFVSVIVATISFVDFRIVKNYQEISKAVPTLSVNSEFSTGYYSKQADFVKEQLFTLATNEKERAIVFFCNENYDGVMESVSCINKAKLPK